MTRLLATLIAGTTLACTAALMAADNDTRNEQIVPRDDHTRRDNPEGRNDASRKNDLAQGTNDVLDPVRPDPVAVDAEYSAELRKRGLLRRIDGPACVEAGKRK